MGVERQSFALRSRIEVESQLHNYRVTWQRYSTTFKSPTRESNVLINLISWPTSTAVLHRTVSSVKSVRKITAAKRDVINRGNYNTTCQCNEKAYCTTLAHVYTSRAQLVFVRNTMRHQRWAAQAGYIWVHRSIWQPNYRPHSLFLTITSAKKYIPRVSKNTCHFYSYDNFGKSEPIFIFISLLNSERISGGSWRHNAAPAVRRTLRPSCSPSLTPAAPSAPCFQ